jgi:hypothetical protein
MIYLNEKLILASLISSLTASDAFPLSGRLQDERKPFMLSMPESLQTSFSAFCIHQQTKIGGCII